VRDFKEVLHLDQHHFEADRYARLTRAELASDVHRGSKFASGTVVAIAAMLLTVLWFRYFVPGGSPQSRVASPAIDSVALVKGGTPPNKTGELTSAQVPRSKPAELASQTVGAAVSADIASSQGTLAVGRVSETMLTVMTPLLLGMIVVGFMLPALIRLKFAGIEAELTQPKEVISAGLKGEASVAESLSTLKRDRAT
jgi:hypothetical protein